MFLRKYNDAEKSSENENKVYAMTLTRPCKSDQITEKHEKAAEVR
jgi:hypothetical protein